MTFKIIKTKLFIILFYSFCITLSLASQNINSQILQNNSFNINLFGAITYLFQNEEGFLEFMTDGDDNYTTIGIMSSYYFKNSFSINTQISKQGIEDLDIDFLTLRYSNTVNNNFNYNFEIGKIRTNVGFLSMGRLNPKNSWGIILPQALYSDTIKRYASGGLGFSLTPTYVFDSGWDLTFDFSFFKPSESNNETLVNTFYGPVTDGKYETGYAIIMKTSLNSITDNYQLYYLFALGQNDKFSPSGLNKDYDQKSMLNQIGFQYNVSKFAWLIEARYYQMWNNFFKDIGDTKRQNLFGFNITTRYWFSPKIVANVFGYWYWTDKIGDWNGQEKADIYGTNRYAHIQHDLYTTLIYNFSKNIDFKFEYHKMFGGAFIDCESNNMVDVPKQWDVIATQISFNF